MLLPLHLPREAMSQYIIYLLWGHIQGDCSQVHLLVGFYAGQDEKYPWKQDDDPALVLVGSIANVNIQSLVSSRYIQSIFWLNIPSVHYDSPSFPPAGLLKTRAIQTQTLAWPGLAGLSALIASINCIVTLLQSGEQTQILGINSQNHISPFNTMALSDSLSVTEVKHKSIDWFC